MSSKSILFYEARVTLGWAQALPLLGLPLFILFTWLTRRDYQSPVSSYELMRAFELVLPLMGGLVGAMLMTMEQDEQFSELRFSYTEPSWRVPLVRTINVLLMDLLALALGYLIARVVTGGLDGATRLDWQAILLPCLSPAVYLAGLSLLVSGLTRSYWASAGIILVYWFLEISFRGQISGILFLFEHSFPQADVDYSLNRFLLFALGSLFLLLNAWFYNWRRRRM
jgi:hypothetical protein